MFYEYLVELCTNLRDVHGLTSACIILDNARVHRERDLQQVTTEFGFEFHFLSPYSYMLNPIECAFSKIKNSVRETLRRGENGSLSDQILKGVESISADDCAGYFRNMTRNLVNSAAGLPYVHY